MENIGSILVILLCFGVWIGWKALRKWGTTQNELNAPDSLFDPNPEFNDEAINTYEKKRNPEGLAHEIEKKYIAISTDLETCERVVKTELERLEKFRKKQVANTITLYDTVMKDDSDLIAELDVANVPNLEVTNHTVPNVQGVTKVTRQNISGNLSRAGVGAGNAVNNGHPAIAVAGVLVSLLGHSRRKRKALEKLNVVRGEVDVFSQEAVGVFDTLKEIRIKTRELYELHAAGVKSVMDCIGETNAASGLPVHRMTLEDKKKLVVYGEQLKRLASIELK